MNVPKIKGTHTAMKTGMLCAEAVVDALQKDNGPILLSDYEKAYKESWVSKELRGVRNIRPSFGTSLGMWGGIAWSGLDSLLLRGHVPWTFSHHGTDSAKLKPAK